MPSPISFLPPDCSAKPAASAPAASTEAPADASASFDSVLTKAAPASGKPTPRASVSGSTRDTGKQDKSPISDETSEETATPERALLSAQELAALLALMGTPTPQAPLPVVPAQISTHFQATTDTATTTVDTENGTEVTDAPAAAVADASAVFIPRVRRAEESQPASFTMPADASLPPTARELVEQGAEVIEYDLASDLPENPATRDTLVAYEKPVPYEKLATYETPAAREKPVVHEMHAARENPAAQQTTTALQTTTAPQAPAVQEVLAVQETPATPEKPALKNSAAEVPVTATPAVKEALTAPVAANTTPNALAPKTKAPASDLRANHESDAPITDAPQASYAPVLATVGAELARSAAPKKPPLKAAAEKVAAPGFSPTPSAPSGVKSLIEPNKNNFLNVDGKDVAGEKPVAGTRAANWGDSMNPESRPAPFALRPLEGAAAVGATFPEIQATGKTTESAGTSPAQAAQIVHEIRDIADSLWSVERNSVEVRFHFSEKEQLSVKVEYRDGVVKTTFRTDSPELRDTIAREWQTQVASASESRPYRVADPVFNTPSADARGFSLGGDSSRQQRQAEHSANAQNTFAAAFGRSSSSSSSVAAAAPALVRPDTALHLHAFA